MRKLILRALAQFPDRPVLVPVIANIVAQSREVMQTIRARMEKEFARYGQDKKNLTLKRIEADLTWKVRIAMSKLVKDGLVKHFDLHEMRAGKLVGHEHGYGSKTIREKRPTPAQFREEMRKLKVVFSDWDQLNKSQGAYQITKIGLGEVEATDGLVPSYIEKPIAM